MCVPNSKFVALLVPEIIGGTLYLVPGYAYAPFSPKRLTDFCSDGPFEVLNVTPKFEVRSITCS